jgi:hypothetical protein
MNAERCRAEDDEHAQQGDYVAVAVDDAVYVSRSGHGAHCRGASGHGRHDRAATQP